MNITPGTVTPPPAPPNPKERRLEVTLIPLKTFDLIINGVTFKNMRQTAQMEGIIEIKNDAGDVATLIQTKSNLSRLLDSVFDGKEEGWMLVRGSLNVLAAVSNTPKDGK